MAINYKFTLVCDDVRREDNGKIILIGVYTGTVMVPQLPFTMPGGLTFFCSLDSDRPGAVDFKLRLQHLETGRNLLEARAGMQFVQPGNAMVPFKLGPLQFQAVGEYNLSIEIEGQREPILVGFNVQLQLPTQ